MRTITIAFVFVAILIYGIAPAQVGAPKAIASSRAGEGRTEGQASAACREVKLTQKPAWAHTGGFTPDGAQLLVVDSLYNIILKYDDAGQSLGAVGEPLKSMLRNQLPLNGKFRGEDFILEVTDGLMRLDKNLRPTSTKRIQPRNEILNKVLNEWRVGGFWQWEPVGERDIVAFVDLVNGDPAILDNWKTGFVRLALDRPGIKVLATYPLTDTPNKGYYRSGYQYITAIGETAYFLSMNQGLKLYKQEKGKDPEDVSSLLPPALRSPDLPDWQNLSDYVDMMMRIEDESLPVGLYGWKDRLYLLYKEQRAKTARWLIYKIDPSEAHEPYQVTRMPIRAEHIMVMPGKRQWAILEKGSVRTYGAQEASRMLLIPTKRVEAPLRSAGTLCN